MNIIKYSYIRKLPNNKWRVFSEKGKNLGTYDTRDEAVTRLRQIEFFKHKKALPSLCILFSKEAKEKEPAVTYSSMMRKLRKDPEQRLAFQKAFKEMFDDAFLENEEDAEKVALVYAIEQINDTNDVHDDVVGKERDDFDHGNIPPAFCPEQSFSIPLDVMHQHNSYSSCDDAGELAARKKILMKIFEMLTKLDGNDSESKIDISDVPSVGQYQNYQSWDGTRGFGMNDSGSGLEF